MLAWTGDPSEVNLQDNKLTVTAFVIIAHTAQKRGVEAGNKDSNRRKLGRTARLLQRREEEGEEGTKACCESWRGPGFRQSQQCPTGSAGHRSSSPNIGLRKRASDILTTAACLFCKQEHRLSKLLKEHLVFLNHF